MKSIKKWENLFPMEVQITKEIIDAAEVQCTESCVGALALLKGLGKNKELLESDCIWGCSEGDQCVKGTSYRTNSFEKHTGNPINLMYVKEPITIIFRTELVEE